MTPRPSRTARVTPAGPGRRLVHGALTGGPLLMLASNACYALMTRDDDRATVA